MNVAQMKQIVSKGCPHYFAPDTMRFFNSCIPKHEPREVGGLVVFITSEQYSDETPRRYSIRTYSRAAESVGTIGLGFLGYPTLAEAEIALNAYVCSQ